MKFPKAKISFSAKISLNTKLVGEGIHILSGTKLGNCEVGRYSYIGVNCDMTNITIGAFTSIGAEVICGLGKHPLNYISTYPGFYSNKASGSEWFGHNHDFNESELITIGSDVWIGTRSIILGGVEIGDGAVIGAGSIVTKNVPAHAVVAGVPGKIIRYRFDEDLSSRILASKWWDTSTSILREAAKYTTQPDDFINYLTEMKQKNITA